MSGLPQEPSEETLESSLVTSIAKPELADLTADLAEVGLDLLLDDGVVRDVPVLATLIGFYRSAGTIRNHIFAKKALRFLTKLGSIPVAEREQFVQKYSDPKGRRRLGEALVLLLDRLDDMNKPEALARLFAAFIKGRYDMETFLRLSSALDRVPLSSMKELKAIYESNDPRLRGDNLSQFAFAGLLNIEFMRTGPTGGPGGSYGKSELGALYLEVLSAT